MGFHPVQGAWRGGPAAGPWIDHGGSLPAGPWIDHGGSLPAGPWIDHGGRLDAGPCAWGRRGGGCPPAQVPLCRGFHSWAFLPPRWCVGLTSDRRCLPRGPQAGQSARPSPCPAHAPVTLGCLGLSPVRVVRGLGPVPPVLAGEKDGEGGVGVRVSPPEALVPAVLTEAQSRVHGFPQEREAVPLALTFYSLLHLLHGLGVTVKVAVSRFKYVKETFCIFGFCIPKFIKGYCC